jgi:hypothetical protein
MKRKEYLLLLDIDARKRHVHEVDRGRITRFVVQLEIKHPAGWRAVVRYDTAHAYTHRDSYDVQGRCRKMALPLGFDDALAFADEDINDNWPLYRDRFLRGEFPI